MRGDYYFDEYDTKKLEKARSILLQFYTVNYDSSLKSRRLNTIIRKIEYLLEDYGDKETLKNGSVNS